MILNRGNKMWQGFFIPEHREELERMQKAEEPFYLHELTEDRWEEIQYLIEEAVDSEHPVDVLYVIDHKVHRFRGFVERVNTHERWLLLANGRHKRRVPFDQLYSVEIVKDVQD